MISSAPTTCCPRCKADTALIADKRLHDADERVIMPLVAASGKNVVSPPKANRRLPREYDHHIYQARHLIENLLRQTQAVPRHRNALRQDRPKLPRRYTPHRRNRLA